LRQSHQILFNFRLRVYLGKSGTCSDFPQTFRRFVSPNTNVQIGAKTIDVASLEPSKPSSIFRSDALHRFDLTNSLPHRSGQVNSGQQIASSGCHNDVAIDESIP